MRQFFNASTSAFDNLEAQSKHACIVFNEQEMPPQTIPHLARVGFEGNTSNGTVLLFIQKNLQYSGPNNEIRAWIAAGEKRFENFTALRNWLQTELMPAYSNVISSPLTTPSPRSEDLTDMNAVRRGLPIDDAQSAVYIDENRLRLELSNLVLGQDHVLGILAHQICLHAAQLHPSGPATLFAVGHSGVGKTQTAESLQTALQAAGNGSQPYDYLRLDMSEYQEGHRIAQLLGAPPGYIGYNDRSQLIDKLVNNPRTIVVFDEIGRAHPNVLTTLMNVISEGRLSSAVSTIVGRQIDCTRAIFYFTSNLGADEILGDLTRLNGFDNPAVMNQVCRDRLKAATIPIPIIGRIGAFLAFRDLDIDTRARIVALSIERCARKYGVRVAYIEPQIIICLLEVDDTKDYGIRPIEKEVNNLLGPVFIDAKRQGIRVPIKLTGMPPSFIVDNAVIENNN